MLTILKNIVLIQLVCFLFSCEQVKSQLLKGDGNITNSERKVSNFNYVEIEDGIDLYLTQGNENKLEIEADQNLHEYIKTEVEGDILKIYLTRHNVFKAKCLKVNLQIIDLKGLSASGGSDVVSNGVIKLVNFSAIGSGGSDISLNIEADEFKLKVSGGSDGRFSGNVKIFKGIASGGSDINAYELETGDCYVEVTGGSDAEVKTSGKLLARGSGGSDVSYKGNPTNIDSNMSGGSDLIRE